MSLIKWSPFYEPFLDVDRAMDSIMSMQSFSPAVDVYEKDDKMIVEVAVSGINPKNIKLNIEDNVLSIEGSSESKKEIDDKHYYRKEVKSGSFHRLVSLPASVESEKAKASYDKGILTIEMPKKEEFKSKSISIDIKESK